MISYLFPGQGSQKKGMGNKLFEQFPNLTEKADKILGYSIKDLCLTDKYNQLNNTQFTQPALYVVNALSYQQKIKQTDIIPGFVAGHSLGEYNALQAADAITFESGLELVKKRGELMSQVGSGNMAAILNISEQLIIQCLEENDLFGIDVANYNSPSQIVISGLKEDMVKAQSVFQKAGGYFIPLKTSGAFHSRYMVAAQSKFKYYLEKIKFSEPKIPVISNVYAKPLKQDQIAENLAKQITHSVRWSQTLNYLHEQGVTHFEELGSGDVLTKLLKGNEGHFLTVKQPKGKLLKKKKLPAILKEDPILKSSTDSELNTKTIRVRDLENLHNKINNWNKTYPVGTKVNVPGFKEDLETRTEALLLFGNKAAIYVNNYNGYFDLDDVVLKGVHS